MLDDLRNALGCLLLRIGMAIVPKEARDFARGVIMYHVPGALTEAEKADIRAKMATADLWDK